MWREELGARAIRGEPPFEYRTLAHLPAAHIAGVQGYFVNPFFMGGPVYVRELQHHSLHSESNGAVRHGILVIRPDV